MAVTACSPTNPQVRLRSFGMERPPIAKRIAAAREKAGLSHEVVAHSIGLDAPSYWDLEAYDDEAFMAVSIAELVALARTLGVSTLDLLEPTLSAPLEPISYAELAELIRARIVLDDVDVDTWGARVGWDVSDILANADSVADLNLDGLRDICSALGVDWRAVVPT